MSLVLDFLYNIFRGRSNSTLQPKDLSSLSGFAAAAVDQLSRDAEAVFGEEGTKAFVGTFKTELLYVGKSLQEQELKAVLARDLVFAFLDDLERLCRWPLTFQRTVHPAAGFEPGWYPCLNRLLSTDNLDAQSKIREVARASAHNAIQFRKKLRVSLQAFTGSEQGGREISLSEVSKSEDINDTTLDHEAAVKRLYKTVSVHCLCECPQGWGYTIANLRLNSPQKEDEVVSFGLLFQDQHMSGTSRSGCQWQDTQISVVQRSRKRSGRKVTFDVPQRSIAREEDENEESDTSKEDNDAPRILNFCELIIGNKLDQLRLTASDCGLEREGLGEPERKFKRDAQSISLAHLIRSPQHLTHRMKALLSFFLAKSVWQFYDSGWMKDEWTKETVHFMCEDRDGSSGKIFIDEPLLHARFEVPTETKYNSKNRTKIHRYPKILALGIMLLEIELGKPIEYFKSPNTIEHEDIHMTAYKIINDKDKWPPKGTFETIHEVTEICLRPEMKKLGRVDKEVRHKLYEHVVAVLEQWLQITLECSPKEQEVTPITPPEEQDVTAPVMPLVKPSPELSQPPTPPTTPPAKSNKLLYQSLEVSSKAHFGIQDNTVSPVPTLPPRGATMTSKSSSGSDYWFERLRCLKEALDISVKRRDESCAAIKVAILDTGICSEFYESVESYIGEYKDFVGSDDRNPKDTSSSQHGTNSFRILQLVYGQAKIYVGRVFKDDEANDRTADLMGQAIMHATKEWEVDVIAMPSGFSSENKGPYSIYDAITFANYRRVLIFTSPSNHGNIDVLTFPGRLYKDSKVFCMFATTADVKPWLSNPDPLNKAPYSFAIFGSDVAVPWCKEPLHGTSISTVIGAALAARILDFSRHPDIRSQIGDITLDLRKVEGMSAVFAKMAGNSNVPYYCMSPWKLLPDETGQTSRNFRRKHISEEILYALGLQKPESRG